MPAGLRAFIDRNREALVVCWLGLILLAALPTQGYLRGDPLRYAAVMKSTLASGDWLTLRLGTEPYFNKPPLVFWFGCSVMAVLGANMFAAHVIAVVPSLGLLLAFRSLARRIVDPQRAFVATVVLATSSVFVRNSGAPRLESSLALCYVGAFAAVLGGETRRPLKALFWVAVGLGVAIKGPGGLLPVGILAVWSLLRRRLDPWDDPWFWLGLPALPLFVAPWLAANHFRYGAVFDNAYFRDDLEATALGNGYSNSPWRKYAKDLVLEWWPWVPFMAHGTWIAVKRLLRGERDRLAPLAVAWVVVVTVSVLSLGRAYSRYLYPVVPVASLLAAESLFAIWPRIAKWDLVRWLALALTVATALVAFGPVDPHGGEVPDIVQFAPCLRAQRADEPVLYVDRRMTMNFQAAVIFHGGSIARRVTSDEVLARLRSGAERVVAVAPKNGERWPPGMARRVLVEGIDTDLVEVTLAPR